LLVLSWGLLAVLLTRFLSTEEVYAAYGVGIVAVLGLLVFALKRAGWASFSFIDVLSRFSDEHRLSAEVGSCVVLFATWFFSIIALRFSVTTLALFLIIMVPLAVLVAIVNVGLFQLLIDHWGLLKTALGIAVIFFSLYITNLVLEALKLVSRRCMRWKKPASPSQDFA
jgi:hypothetical protein